LYHSLSNPYQTNLHLLPIFPGVAALRLPPANFHCPFGAEANWGPGSIKGSRIGLSAIPLRVRSGFLKCISAPFIGDQEIDLLLLFVLDEMQGKITRSKGIPRVYPPPQLQGHHVLETGRRVLDTRRIQDVK